MKIFVEASSSLETFFNGKNEIILDDNGNFKIEDLLEPCSIPLDEVGIIILNGKKSSLDDKISDGDKIKLFPPIIAG